MDQVIVFDKSLQQRLQEYLDILSGHEVLSVSQIKREWAFFLELTLDPNGWQAVWKIPRMTCELYKISFPTIVLVYVEDTHFENLEAVVKILAVQDDNISLPDEHTIPLIHLWPTRTQDKSIVLNIQSTANALDMLRFFYNNLITAWDYDDEDTSDWLSKHLESRLRLYYDIRNGSIPRALSEYIQTLFVESRHLQAKRSHLEMEISSDDDDIEVNTNNIKNEKLNALMDIHVRVMQIKSEMEILENPLLRNVILKQQKYLIPEKENSVSNYWLICEPSHVNEYISFLKQVEQYYPNEIFKFTSDLASTLDEISFTDVIILNKSKYDLNVVSRLDYGGILRGIYEKNDTIIVSQSEEVMFDISKEVVIENVTLNVAVAQCGLLVRKGKLILKNCNLICDMKSSTHQGIIVLNGSHLDIIDCNISGFATAIVGNSGSQILMKNCKIFDVNFGIKVYDNCLISIQQSTFQNCKEYGFCIQTDKIADQIQKVGDFDILKIIPDINIEEVDGYNNGKGNVIINNEQKIIPIKDLFTNLDLTYGCKRESLGEENDMDVSNEDLNDTVIEGVQAVHSEACDA